ncbi:Tex family protein [Mesorhizobium sp. YM1C-6-2]|uniref:Tex family protein n=1 Tax=Mesorhizobium sp. YM1C-6-2 TaxID=1827501 RepID=UPI000EF1F6B7|nr:Tex family protein [Mesorhizobium sp. YM1C-6-2]RLP28046.1 RNA-binding transcriptional accessory protein [Mesorhizobium sp. YM1C-6-2]
MNATEQKIFAVIAGEIGAAVGQVAAAVGLLDEGATVPFVARYRKEVTGGLDDTQLRNLADRLTYLRDFEARRAAIFQEITSQGKMTDELAGKLAGAATKAEIEDIYAPYKPKRRTKAEIARERGLQPLADLIFDDRSTDPQKVAEAFVAGEVADVKAALDGARDILAERFSEEADLVGRLRTYMKDNAVVVSKLIDGKADAGAKFSDYFDYREKWSTVPSHRALAIFRGRNEDVLSVEITVDAGDPAPVKPVERMIAHAFSIGGSSAADSWLMQVVGWTWRVKLSLQMSLDLTRDLRERAEEEAIRVFARNLKDLMLAAPAGTRPTLGLDPGIRTGVKVAALDATGKVLETATIYPFQPKNDVRGAQAELARLIVKHRIELIAIGNGTASRETEKLVGDLLADMPAPKPTKVIVSEAGASVYSASELAATEFPGLDVSLRGAVSIGRRLQDPLAELVKVEPKAIGVGQYQHDVDQYRLAKALDAVVEDAVNGVGVDLNTASAPLLARVSGLGQSVAEAIVLRRDTQGPFRSRSELLSVPRLGARTFEQCAGFLRIRDGEEALDASSVHPEAYPVARKIVEACGRDIRSLMGDGTALRKLNPQVFVDERFGLPTVKDILAELEKPGRDPRPSFKTATFADGIDDIKDLKPGMSLEGTVTNVAAFGAFVDVGVHQDGLVHISQIADRFVKDPNEVVKVGQVVRVKVVEVDVARKRIGLSMRKDAGAGATGSPASGADRGPRNDGRSGGAGKGGNNRQSALEPKSLGGLGEALLRAQKR